MIKAVGIVRFLSIVLFFMILALVYAYLPVKILIIPENTDIKVDRSDFFYIAAGIFLIVNIISWVFYKALSPRIAHLSEKLQALFKGFSPILNVSIVFIVGFVGVINNPQHISANSYVYLTYLVPVLFIGWTAGVIYLSVKEKKSISTQ